MHAPRWRVGTDPVYSGSVGDNPGSRRVEIPSVMLAFNKAVIAEHRANGGRLCARWRPARFCSSPRPAGGQESRARPFWATAGTGDQASGHQRRTTPGAVTSCLVPQPARRSSAARKSSSGRSSGVRARTAGPRQRDELGKVVPYLEPRQTRRAREIPIVVAAKWSWLLAALGVADPVAQHLGQSVRNLRVLLQGTT